MTHENGSNRKNESKEWMKDALLSLMSEKPYRKITVTDVALRADLSRRTFYRHFDAVDDVLFYTISRIGDEYLEVHREVRKHKRDFKKLTVSFFTFWEPRKEFLLLLQKNDLFYLLMQVFWKDLYDKLITGAGMSETDEYIFSFSTGGIWHLLEQWLHNGAKRTPEEMGAVAEQIQRYMM